ncbi:MAG: carboxypeptidase regulatory-like domain-containing protein, partial [Bacteroidales bacterium]
MKKLRLLFLALLAIACQFSYADTKVEPGTSNTYYPISFDDTYSFMQTVYTPDEIGAGTLNGISLYYKGTYDASFEKINVYVSEIDGIEAPQEVLDAAEGTLVFSGPFSVVKTDNPSWVKITFKDEFKFSGEKNLLISVQREGDASMDKWEALWGTAMIAGPKKVTTKGYGFSDFPLGGYVTYRMAMIFHGLDFEYGSIEGTVTDANGAPVESAKIFIDDMKTPAAKTDADGKYLIAKIQAGIPFVLSCTKENGYNIDTKEVNVNINETAIVDFVIGKPSVLVTPGKLFETMIPNEFRTRNIDISNLGDGLYNWTASIDFDQNGGRSSRGYKVHAGEIFAYKDFGKFEYADLPVLTKYLDMGALSVPETNIADTNVIVGGVFPIGVEDFYYTITKYGMLFSIDISDDIATFKFMGQLGEYGTFEATDMCVDPVSRDIFITTKKALYHLNFDNKEPKMELVGEFNFAKDEDCMGMAIDRSGKGYMISSGKKFYSVELFTANNIAIGKTKFEEYFVSTLHWDPETDKLHTTEVTPKKGSFLYTVDKETGAFSEKIALGDTYYAFLAQPVKRYWLTMDEYKGSIAPNGGKISLGVHFDALDRIPGILYTATIKFTADYGKVIKIPVTMEITGEGIPVVEDVKAILTNQEEGAVKVEWIKNNNPNINHYKVMRNGEVVAVTKDNFVIDDLPNYEYGIYYYWVTTVLKDGTTSSPAGPEQIAWWAPEACDIEENVEEDVWVDNMKFVYYPIKNCGSGLLKFEFPEFENEAEVKFISEVLPRTGVVAPDHTVYVRFKYDALPPKVIGEKAWPKGEYTTTTKMITNSNIDAQKEITINHTMNVIEPALIVGQVRDGNTNERLAGVQVKAVEVGGTEVFVAETDDAGKYEIKVDELSDDSQGYELFFNKVAYQSVAKPGPYKPTLDTKVVVDAKMFEKPYAPGSMLAVVNKDIAGKKDDTYCDISWTLPWGEYEMLYDDGTAEAHLAGKEPGSSAAVKFTPMGYPTKITGAKIFVGDGSFPKGTNFIGSQVKVSVYFPNKDTQMPDAKPVEEKIVEVNNTGWVEFNNIFDKSEIVAPNPADKDTYYPEFFYIVVTQIEKIGSASPVGVDLSEPKAYKSYVCHDGVWSVSPLQDLMIRAIVEGADDSQTPKKAKPSKVSVPKVPANNDYFIVDNMPKIANGYEMAPQVLATQKATRNVVNYTLERIHIKDIFSVNKTNWKEDPSTLLKKDYNKLTYCDKAWDKLPQGFYAYKVKAHFTNGDISEWTYSNIVAHKRYADVDINVSLKFGDGNLDPKDMIADSTEITMVSNVYPYKSHYREIFDIESTPEKANCHFPDESEHKWFVYGNYSLKVFKIGFDLYSPKARFEIYKPNFVINVNLQQKKYRVRGLEVDPLTSVATWPKARITELYEDFQGFDFPPAGWTEYSIAESGDTQGWFHASNDNAINWSTFPEPRFLVPERDGFWAEVNEDYNGSTSNGSLDYLITPAIDLRESGEYGVEFDQYFTGAESSRGYVEFSIDGQNWYELGEVEGKEEWHKVRFDIDDKIVLNDPINFKNYGSEDPNEGEEINFDGKDGQRKVYFAFHYYDDHQYSTGWCIDNVSIVNGAPNFESYEVSLNGRWQGEVAKDPFEGEYDTGKFHWWFPNLIYGEIYTAGVKGKYASGLSEADEYTWKSTYLIPPYVFEGSIHGEANVLTWHSPRFWVKGDDINHATGAIDPTGSIPGNLIGFHLYRNGEENPCAFIERDDEGLPYAYTDKIEPGEYEYYISAVYDLTQYGKPAQRGESQLVGPVNIDLAWGYELPFFENWGENPFENNKWATDGENWKVDQYSGNDRPCAQFDFKPKAMEYEKALITAPINGVNALNGAITFKFDIKLDNANPTGKEELRVQIGEGKEWTTITTYKNIESFDWKTVSFDITNRLQGKVKRIRFLAKGDNTNDIRSWYIDNVSVDKFCPQIEDLKAEVFNENHTVNTDKNGINLTWSFDPGASSANDWIKHVKTDDFNDYYSIPNTSGEIYVGAKYSAEKLKNLVGAKFDKIRAIFGTGVSTIDAYV